MKKHVHFTLPQYMACQPCPGHCYHTTCSKEGWRDLLAWLFALPQRADHFYKYQLTGAEQYRSYGAHHTHFCCLGGKGYPYAQQNKQA